MSASAGYPTVPEPRVSHRRSETRHKTEVISVRVTPDEKAAIAAWAELHGYTLSEALLLSFTATSLMYPEPE